MPRLPTRIVLVATGLAAWAGPVPGQVVLNEIMARPCARSLRWSADGTASIGVTPAWHQPGFDDSQWPTNRGAFGFGGTPVAVDLSAAMANVTGALYLRTRFETTAEQAGGTNVCHLELYFDDGFAAWLNGRQLGRYNLGPAGLFIHRDHPCFDAHNPGERWALTFRPADWFVAGTNTLAIQAMNRTAFDADFHIEARLYAGDGALDRFAWAAPAFDDSAWRVSHGPMGFDANPHYSVGTNLVAEMRYATAALYLRTRFNATAAEAASGLALKLEADWDDGLIVFLNGREVLRQNAGEAGAFIAHFGNATASRAATGDKADPRNRSTTCTLGAASGLLVPGENVLAALLLNSRRDDDDLILRARLQNPVSGGYFVLSEHEWRYWVGLAEPAPVARAAGAAFVGDEAVWRYLPGVVEPSGGLYDPAALTNRALAAEWTDWIELCNTGATAVALGGWSLSDDADEPRRWVFPATTIGPGETLLVLADGTDPTNADGRYLRASFTLDDGGEFLALYDAATNRVDLLGDPYPPQDPLHSYGRVPGTNAPAWFAVATPGAANTAPPLWRATAPPVFSAAGGFHSTGIVVGLSCPDAGVTIRYTTDGTDPTPWHGSNYFAALQFTNPVSVCARAFHDGWIPSAPAVRTFLVRAAAELTKHAAVCLVLDEGRSLGPPLGTCAIVKDSGMPGGDYMMTDIRGETVERPASLEWWRSDGGGFQAPIGVRFAGSNFVRDFTKLTRLNESPWPNSFDQKPSLNFFFGGAFGTGPLEFALLHGEPDLDRFESLRLRSGHNDMKPFIKDEFIRRTVAAMGHPSALGIMNTLFVNGKYKGYFNLCERVRGDFLRKWYGGREEWDIYQPFDFVEGDAAAWTAARAFVRTNDLADIGLYTQALERVDAPQFIDYLLPHIYAAVSDWPHNNFVAARERSARGRFRLFAWDAEISFNTRDTNRNTIAALDSSTFNPARSDYGIRDLWTGLSRSPEFRLLFADRVEKHFFGAGALTDAAMTARVEALRAEIYPLVPDDTSWFNAWRAVRRPIVFGHFAAASLWPAVRAPTFNAGAGPVTNGFALAIAHTNGVGAIRFTLDGSDPRGPGGATNGLAYAGPVPLSGSVVVRARVVRDGEWSPEAAARFDAPDVPRVVITEIMPEPPEGGGLEFIELHNAGAAQALLHGARFAEGVAFTFPPGAALGAGGFAVLARDAAAFAARYPGVSVAGVFDGKLANEGERLALVDAAGRPICSAKYGRGAPWPALAAGHGFSLVAAWPPPAVHTRAEEPSHWRASSRPGGSPGAWDPAPAAAAVRISEVLTHSEPSARDAIELHNAGAAPVDVGGWLLTDDADVPRKFVIPAGTVISPGEYLVFDEADFNPVPGVPPSFSLSSLGEEVWLFSADSGGNLAGYAHGFAFPAAAPGETFGRYLTSTGEEHFPPQSAASIGAANAGPRVGPVVISEILYRPTTQGVEFVEIHNASDAPVALFDPANPTNCWRISGVGFVFPTGQVLEAGAVAVVAATSPAAFAASRALPPDAALYGPFAGRLDDAGDTLALLRPDPPDPLDPGGPPPEILVDRVRYRNAAPWPVPPAGAGRSLERADARAYGDDPANWRLSAADDGTPGALSLPVVRHAIRTLPTAGGAILPADPLVVHGSNVALEIRADRYYRVVRLLVDGEAQPATNRFTFSGVTNDHTLAAEFAENLAEHGVPERWLAAYALTNRPWNAEAADDQDGDGLPTWQEFVAGTAPTDALSTLRVGCPTHAPVAPVVTWMSVTGRWYAVQAGVPPSPDWAALVHTQGVGGPITITNAVPEAPCVFYRVTVSRERSD